LSLPQVGLLVFARQPDDETIDAEYLESFVKSEELFWRPRQAW
jgi:hypothetical protein